MDNQVLFNTFIAIIIAGIGWFARTLWDAVKELRSDLHNIELHLPNTYVKQIDINARFDKLENMIEKIFDRLEHKQDKIL